MTVQLEKGRLRGGLINVYKYWTEGKKRRGNQAGQEATSTK